MILEASPHSVLPSSTTPQGWRVGELIYGVYTNIQKIEKALREALEELESQCSLLKGSLDLVTVWGYFINKGTMLKNSL